MDWTFSFVFLAKHIFYFNFFFAHDNGLAVLFILRLFILGSIFRRIGFQFLFDGCCAQ